MSPRGASTWSLVKVPVFISLGVTVLRLVGELSGWSDVLVGNSPGGGGAIIGIGWLIPVFGFLFGRRIRAEYGGPGSGRVAVIAVLGLGFAVVMIAGLMGAGWIVMPERDGSVEPRGTVYFMVSVFVAAVVAFCAWRRLGLTLLVYALLARATVAIVTVVSIAAGWSTHYVKPAPGTPPLEGVDLAFTLLLAQCTFWPALTIIGGTIFGAIGAATAKNPEM